MIAHARLVLLWARMGTRLQEEARRGKGNRDLTAAEFGAAEPEFGHPQTGAPDLSRGNSVIWLASVA
jgi:hypothetical protein